MCLITSCIKKDILYFYYNLEEYMHNYTFTQNIVQSNTNMIPGNDNANSLYGTESNDDIKGFGGNDVINGYGGSDL
ncbi:hypothetical protein, partial [Enterobacter hormaechei]